MPPFDAKAELIEKHRKRVDPNDEQRSPTYAAMVESLDDNVGKMLDALDRLDLADNTIIFFFSDNGGNMYNEVRQNDSDSESPVAWRERKQLRWRDSRVPCVISWPGEIEEGVFCEELITSTDFYPTILDMLGMEASA